METRITSPRITELKPGEIFVFGSNLEGVHGGGAALLAWKKWGAVWGQGAGLQGQIPSLGSHCLQSLPKDSLHRYLH